jgi:hypothetical protein
VITEILDCVNLVFTLIQALLKRLVKHIIMFLVFLQVFFLNIFISVWGYCCHSNLCMCLFPFLRYISGQMCPKHKRCRDMYKSHARDARPRCTWSPLQKIPNNFSSVTYENSASTDFPWESFFRNNIPLVMHFL